MPFVAGTFDFLAVHPMDSLESIWTWAESSPKTVAIGAHSGIILAADDNDSMSEEFAGYVKTSRNNNDDLAKSHPILASCKLSLSPVTYELVDLYTGVLDTVDALKKAIKKKLGSVNDLPESLQMFRTLGSPDIVILALPQSYTELLACNRLFQQIRELSILELVSELAPSAGSIQHDVDSIVGHALAACDEMIAFRVDRDGNFHFSENHARQIRIDFGLRLDCGHENVVREACGELALWQNGEEQNTHTWDRYPVRGTLSSLGDLVEFWQQQWANYDYRASNLIDSTSVVSFPEARSTEPNGHKLHSLAWCLRDQEESDIWHELSKIDDTLTAWSIRFLPDVQRNEFQNTVRSFRSCFLHHELASAARDLIPFFRQLSLACSQENFEAWSHYRAETDVERFSEEVSTLFQHLNRAVRNRLEHRSHTSDPTVRHTLEHGACKLVNAYTAIYWFCGEVFSRRTQIDIAPESEWTDYCDASHLAVAVASGAQGRVACREVFSGFRKHCERLIGSRISDEAPDTWTSRLLLLEISGKTLFRPEICMVHCLHETAEFSDWLEKDETAELRCRLNEWSIFAYEDYLGKSALDPDGSVSPGREELQQELVRFLDSLIRKAIDQGLEDPSEVEFLSGAVPGQAQSAKFERPANYQEAIRKLHPVEFSKLLHFAITQKVPTEKAWTDTAEWRSQAEQKYVRVPLIANDVKQAVVADKSLLSKLRYHRELLKEVAADVGMWCAFDHLVSDGKPQKRSENERLHDVHLIYTSIIEAHMERAYDAVTHDEAVLFLIRWAIQAAAVSEDEATWVGSIISWLEKIIEKEEIEHHAVLQEQETAEASTEAHRRVRWKGLLTEWTRAIPESQESWQEAVRALPGSYQTIFPIETDSDEDSLTLVSSLRRKDGDKYFLYYWSRQKRKRLISESARLEQTFFFPFQDRCDVGQAEKSLWDVFNRTWQTHRAHFVENNASSSEMAMSQLELVFHTWAKACRLRYSRAFQPVDVVESANDA